MRRGYGQYCPLALATELLCRRWTVLVISRLLDGCTTFGEIQRGIPRISPTMLSQRLAELEHAGIATRNRRDGQSNYCYGLTEAGKDLESIVWKMSVWGQQWARDMDMDDLDPGFLAWSMHLRLHTAAMPAGRTVLQFEFANAPADCQRFWLVNNDGAVDMCLKNPGFETDLLIESDLRLFVEVWRGFRKLEQEIRRGSIRLHGPPAMRKAFPDWLLYSMLSPYERRRAGREQELSASPTT